MQLSDFCILSILDIIASMKKKLALITLLFSALLSAQTKSVVSIVPEQTFAKKIGGDAIEVATMVMPGDSPHTYEPKPSQMRQIADADLYFAIGVEFENIWLPKFRDLNPHLAVIDVTKGIEKIPMATEDHEEEHEEEHHDAHEHHHAHSGLDPHLWTAPSNVRIISRNIADALIQADPSHENTYRQGLAAWLAEVNATDEKIRQILSKVPKGTKFMVFHPSWGYFAKEYGLVQLPVEIEGKAPKPKALIRLIKEARRQKVRAIFTQPEFSDTSAQIIAKELGIPVIKVSPMAPDWSANLIRIAKAIAGGA